MADSHNRYENATIVSIEIAEFMRIGQMLNPEVLCGLLDSLVTVFEAGLRIFRLEGIGFFNGVYTALATSQASHASDATRYALYCITQADSVPVDMQCLQHGTILVCAAVHSGPVVCVTLYGRTAILGETMTDVSRMLQDSGTVGCVSCSGATAMQLDLGEFQVDGRLRLSWTGQSSAVQAVRLVHPSKGLLGGACLVCPVSAKLTHHVAPYLSPQTQDIAGLFGFMPSELRHMRMLYGPDTDANAISCAMRRVSDRLRRAEVQGVVLYTRNGMPRPCALVFDFVPSMRLLSVSCTV